MRKWRDQINCHIEGHCPFVAKKFLLTILTFLTLNMEKVYNLGILLFDQVELLDFSGPYEVFSSANGRFKVYLEKIFLNLLKHTLVDVNSLISALCRYSL